MDAGAAIVDIGGVKAGARRPVAVAEEIDRVVPVRRARGLPDAVISVDTWRAEVGRAAAEPARTC